VAAFEHLNLRSFAGDVDRTELLNGLRRNHSIEVQVYPDVKHGFADPHWGASGEILGFLAAYDPNAAENALVRAHEFVDRTIKGKSP
jgi:dienelactone hydrolase